MSETDLDVNEFCELKQFKALDAESDQQSSETIMQKLNNTKSDYEYKVFT